MLVRYEVKVLMGDFNMWLFRVIPEMRQRGLTIDLGAWLPWKGLPGGLPKADSTGIFMVEAPGQYTLVKNVRHLHADPEGILSTAVAGDDGFLHIEENTGPGKELRTYLPKQMSLDEKLRGTLTPSEASHACVGKVPRMEEKRVDAHKWQLEGRHQHGSHFAIAIFGCSRGQGQAATRSGGGELQAAVAEGLRRPR